ncbi:hypothetical protein [Haloarchaeobius sp. DFWS5]|uniref:hypothetical protein n=1 Tax=Haloarchaeobius sp. DFWS5 TaxID=3446114 RepID=UPI003EBB046C
MGTHERPKSLRYTPVVAQYTYQNRPCLVGWLEDEQQYVAYTRAQKQISLTRYQLQLEVSVYGGISNVEGQWVSFETDPSTATDWSLEDVKLELNALAAQLTVLERGESSTC